MDAMQSNEVRQGPPSKAVSTVQDLIDFLTECVSRTPGLRDDEAHVQIGSNAYKQVNKISLVDDNFIIETTTEASEPFWHEE